MNGKVSKRVIGEFSNVKKYGSIGFALLFLKKDISSNILSTIVKLKKITQILSKYIFRKF